MRWFSKHRDGTKSARIQVTVLKRMTVKNLTLKTVSSAYTT